jgi:hypothetical protein
LIFNCLVTVHHLALDNWQRQGRFCAKNYATDDICKPARNTRKNSADTGIPRL